MNENHTNQQGLTLEEIAVHKQALKIAIAEQQQNLSAPGQTGEYQL